MGGSLHEPYGQNANSYETSSFNGYQSGAGGAYAAYPKDYTTGEGPYLSTYPSYYPATAETAMPADTRAYLTVTVPANAQVWVGDRLSSQRGTVRQFYSSPLTPGKNFTYEIRARWLPGGRGGGTGPFGCRWAPAPKSQRIS